MNGFLRPQTGRQAAVLAFDGAIGATSLLIATVLRFEADIPAAYRESLPIYMVLLVGCRVVSTYMCRLHQWSFRFSGLADAVRIGFGGVIGTALFSCVIFLFRHSGPPRSVVVLELLLSWFLMAGMRFSPRLAQMYVRDWVRSRREGALRTVIVGAGSAGESLLRDLQRNDRHGYQILGFVDDDRAKLEQIVGGKTVLGSIDDLHEIAVERKLDQVLIAIPKLDPARIRRILDLCADVKMRFQILPYGIAYLDEANASMIRDLRPQDLLHREPVTFNEEHSQSMPERTALVTGAAGSIGSEIVEQLLRAGAGTVVLTDVNENGIYLGRRRLERAYPDQRIVCELLDIRDPVRVREVFARYRPTDVFHAAAHKHVPLLEAAPCEAIKNNVVGTRNLARAADEFQARRFVCISTDKAVKPTNVMGASKRVAEQIVRSMVRRSTTKYCAVRFGNVLGSAGSVLPIFQEQIASGGPVTVTHPDVTRYFMTIPEAVALVLQAAYGDHGELCVLDMGEPLKILDLARHVITLSGKVPDVDVKIEFSGLRPGEKLHEELLADDEERLRNVDERILVAERPEPRADLDDRVDELALAAAEGRTGDVVAGLADLVPGYVPSPGLLEEATTGLRTVARA